MTVMVCSMSMTVMVCSMTVIVCSICYLHTLHFWRPLPFVHLDSWKAGYIVYKSTCTAGYVICQNDIFTSVTVLWSGTLLFSLLWCCKVVTPPFVQLSTRVYARPTKIDKFMSATCRGSKIDFLAVLTILRRIEWSRSAVGN